LTDFILTAPFKDTTILKGNGSIEMTLFKQKGITTLNTFLLNLCFATSANALETFKPYVGFDVQQRTVNMVPGYGEGLFNKRVPQGNIYVGFNFHEYFGIEVGQQFTQGSTRTALTSEGSILLGGTLIVPGQFEVTESNIKMMGAHANIVGRIPLPIANSHLILSAGAVALELKSTVKSIASDFGVFHDETEDKKFSSRRVIPQLSGGLEFSLAKDIKLRFLTSYEITSKFKNIQSKHYEGYIMSFKNNLIFGLGFNVEI
jgi:hypothetical protein